MSQPALLDRAVGIAADINLAHVPAASLERAGHIIADTVGVSRAGQRQDEMRRLVDIESRRGQAGEGPRYGSTVFGEAAVRAEPERAAFLNATAGSFVELDEGMRPTGHPGMQVVIPAVATAEAEKAHGQSLLRAVIAGYEVTARLFTAYRLRYPAHPHGHFGAVGGAVAVAMILDRDPLEAARIAATSPILSVWDACFEGATARNTWMGSAAELAVRASRLAEAGFAGSPTSLESAFGLLAGTLADADALSAPLDYAGLGLTRNYFKIHSACALSHAAVDAVGQLPALDPVQIAQVDVETVNNNMKLARQSAPNALSARFSLPYVVAAALLGRAIEADSFRYEADVAQLAERVQVRVADDLEAQWPGASPARVTVRTTDGHTYGAQVDNPHGHYRDPLTADEVRLKFHSLVGNEALARAWWGRMTNLFDVPDCSRLFLGADGHAH
ncbi:MmgE/PrpD family protein [Castellaniella sp. S9]|uniref:MmgE/PrpD family protein n=1 Tax=Castellaniella sp. S9 TaxID=2993652 RepID=UPI0022B52BAE|nr:MmgE/PrpD family protein [Castellaniella sp. S9]